MRFLWGRNLTPGSMLRLFGPCGRALAKKSFGRRTSRMALREPLSARQGELLGHYLYENIGADGSGEFCLNKLLHPGAWAIEAVGPLLVAAAALPESDPRRLRCPVSFSYGQSHDWMSSDAGMAAAKALAAAQRTARGCSVYLIPRSGHHLYLENAPDFNAAAYFELCKTVFGAPVAVLPADLRCGRECFTFVAQTPTEDHASTDHAEPTRKCTCGSCDAVGAAPSADPVSPASVSLSPSEEAAAASASAAPAKTSPPASLSRRRMSRDPPAKESDSTEEEEADWDAQSVDGPVSGSLSGGVYVEVVRRKGL
jgi:hypothetical protein